MHSSSYFPANECFFLLPEQDSARHPRFPKPEATYAGAAAVVVGEGGQKKAFLRLSAEAVRHPFELGPVQDSG